jgi:hypothetical protein
LNKKNADLAKLPSNSPLRSKLNADAKVLSDKITKELNNINAFNTEINTFAAAELLEESAQFTNITKDKTKVFGDESAKKRDFEGLAG